MGASIGATAAAIGKVATGTPLQKVLTVGLGAILGGAVHVAASSANRSIAESFLESKKQIKGVDIPPSSISPSSIYEPSFFDNLLSNNPVESFLLAINIINIISFLLIILLIVSLVSKHISKIEYEFKWIDNLIPLAYNSFLKNILNKVLKIWNYSSSINIWLIIILLLISVCASIYFINILILNFESFCELYLKYLNK